MENWFENQKTGWVYMTPDGVCEPTEAKILDVSLKHMHIRTSIGVYRISGENGALFILGMEPSSEEARVSMELALELRKLVEFCDGLGNKDGGKMLLNLSLLTIRNSITNKEGDDEERL